MEISVIIPVYNVEKYINECIDSVLCQTYTDYELILVDDGSTDKSYDICNTYAKLSNKIRIFKKRNEGVSSARNFGLKYAIGNYITFIDSDDFVSPDYLENLHKGIEYDIDYVFSGLIYYECGIIKSKDLLDNRYWDLTKEKDFVNFLQQSHQTSPCAKLYSKKIIDKFNLHFNTSLSYAEDKDFNLSFFDKISKARSLSFSGYYYRKDVTDSLSKQYHAGRFEYQCIHWELKRRMCEDRAFIGVDTNKFLVNDLYNIYNDEIVNISSHISSLYDGSILCKKEMQNVDVEYLKNSFKVIEAPFWQKKLILNKLFTITLFIYKCHKYVK